MWRTLIDEGHAAVLLVHACNGGELSMVQQILAAGQDPSIQLGSADEDSEDGMNCTPLTAACHGGHEPCVRELLDYGADPNQPRPDATTPLIAACSRGHPQCVQLLLQAGADPHKEGEAGVTPLLAAIGDDVDQLRCVMLLLGNAAASPDLDFALYFACHGSHAACAKVLLTHGANPDGHRGTNGGLLPLHVATHGGDVPVAYELLEAGADKESVITGGSSLLEGATPMVTACVSDQLPMVQLLSSYGASRNPSTTELPVRGTTSTDPITVWLVESSHWTPLHHAGVVPVERTRTLLRAGADLHALGTGPTGTPINQPTPLQLAQQDPTHPGFALVLAASQWWSPDSHALMPDAARARAVALLRLGYLLSWQPRFATESQGLLDAWREYVMPHALDRGSA